MFMANLAGFFGRKIGKPVMADFKKESSYEGHTVDALVLTGDEGRDKLR